MKLKNSKFQSQIQNFNLKFKISISNFVKHVFFEILKLFPGTESSEAHELFTELLTELFGIVCRI